nr:unnamed protein product [Callosobruchus analis]
MCEIVSKKDRNKMLIELVKNYRLLYDASDPNFNNRIERHRCWEKISANIDLPGKTLMIPILVIHRGDFINPP